MTLATVLSFSWSDPRQVDDVARHSTSTLYPRSPTIIAILMRKWRLLPSE